MAVLALFALLVLGLSSAREENCVTISWSCFREELVHAEERLEAGDTGEAGWTAIVCGDAMQQDYQINFWNSVYCS